MRTIMIAIVWLAVAAIYSWISTDDYQQEQDYWVSFCEKNPLPEQCKEFVE